MKIQVFGSGCPTCKKLFDLTSQAVKELKIDEKVEYITDVQKMLELGVMSSPVLAIDGKPVMIGLVSNIEKIKDLIRGDKNNKKEDSSQSSCSCGSC